MGEVYLRMTYSAAWKIAARSRGSCAASVLVRHPADLDDLAAGTGGVVTTSGRTRRPVLHMTGMSDGLEQVKEKGPVSIAFDRDERTPRQPPF
jgi:hypothetical protein